MVQVDVVERLLKEACASIQTRVRREILDEPADSASLRSLEIEILKDEAVQAVIDSQRPDGWLGERFHGYESLEAGIRLLCEKGISSEHPVLANALQALHSGDNRIRREMGTVGRVLDEGGFGGASMIRATILAYAGLEDDPLVREQVEEALQTLQAVADVESMSSVSESYRGNLVFKSSATWPGIYHLRLLAFTGQWRTPENRQTLANSVRRLVELSPLPFVHVRRGSQLISPASFGMLDFNPHLAKLNAAQWMAWFHRTELLARLGVVEDILQLRRQVQALHDMLEPQGGWFKKRLAHAYFRRWGAYTGLMLERDWRAPRRRVFDLTFRSLLILHYAGAGRR